MADSVGLGGSVLGLVQVKGVAPGGGGVVEAAEGGEGFAEVFQGVGFLVGETEVLEHGECSLVVVACLGVFAGLVGHVAERVEDGGFGLGVGEVAEEGEAGFAAGAGFRELAE